MGTGVGLVGREQVQARTEGGSVSKERVWVLGKECAQADHASGLGEGGGPARLWLGEAILM